MLNEILDYQKKDAILVKIEQDLANSSQKRDVNRFVEQIKQAQNKLVLFEEEAQTLVAEFEQLSKQFENEKQKLKDAQNLYIDDKNEDELRSDEVAIMKQLSGLLALNKDIKTLSNKITQIIKDFDKTKNYGIECKQKYKISLEKYNEFSDKKINERETIINEMNELKKHIDPKIMDRYLKMREDHKFPILVPLVNNSCGVCAMNLPNARLDLLNAKGVLECENCHRLIYIKSKE